jgi:N4-gp56 family major capsid protein
MATNVASQFAADVEAYIADETLPLARRQLVLYQFGDPAELPEGRGVVYTAVRYNRVPLPFAPLSEGVPPLGQTMTVATVSATALQWGDKITLTDVAEITIKHPLFKKAIELVALQMAETLERNTNVALMAGTQVNYVNSRGSRAALVAGDVLDTTTVIRTQAALATLGAPRFSGDEQTDAKIAAQAGGARASENPRAMPHYVAVGNPLVLADFRTNATVIQAWTYSDINRLYNAEAGEWSGIRFCSSNMVPSFTGQASVAGTAGTSGSLASGTYAIQVTCSDTQNQYESIISQVTTGIVVTGPTGSISVTLPAQPGYTCNIYISQPGVTTMANLAQCSSGPVSGPLQGMATQLTPGTTVVLTAIGTAQTPPAAPATGVTVYPTHIIGRGYYAQVVLRNAEFTYLTGADKSDVLNQLRVVGWKCFYGTLIENTQYGARIESSSAFSTTFT